MEQKKLTNLTLTAAIIAVLGVFLGSYIWVPYLRSIFLRFFHCIRLMMVIIATIAQQIILR